MTNPLIRKLGSVEAFSSNDLAVLERLCSRSRLIEAKQDIIRVGEAPADVHLVLDGVACRYKLLPQGGRQIVAVLVPGDFCDLHVAILGKMDHSICAVTDCTVVDISATAIRELTDDNPQITRALWWATLVDEGTLREWISSLGQRDASERMAHLLCELLVRLQLVDLADDNSYDLPLTQTDLADVLGLTSVHVNRTLQDLRGQGLVTLQSRRLTIPDVERLKDYCNFDPIYLHLEARRPPLNI